MSERPTAREEFPTADRLVNKPIMKMTLPEYEAWCTEYIDRDDEDRLLEFDVFVERRQSEMVECGEV